MNQTICGNSSEPIFKFFFLIGLEDDDLKTKEPQELEKILPTILASYKNEAIGDNNEFEVITKTLLTDQYILGIIFPQKIDYLNDITITENAQIPDIPILRNYIFVRSSRTEVDSFFHCFCNKYWGDDYFDWYFNCLIYFETIIDREEPLYAAKAIILVTSEPYFTLAKEVITEIYYNIKENLEIPLEVYIKNIFFLIKKPTIENQILIHMRKNNYLLKKELLLSPFDLNLSIFFSLFTLEDFLVMAESFLLQKDFIIVSNDISILYPIYHIFITLMSPLNITDNTYCYKLISPASINVLLIEFIFSLYSSIFANNINEKVFYQLAKKKEKDLLVAQITYDKKKYTIEKNTYYFKKSGSVKKIKGFVQKRNQSTTQKIFNQCDINLQQYIIQYIKELVHTLKEDYSSNEKHKIFEQNQMENSQYLRRLFFSFMIKFFKEITIPPTFKFTKKGNNPEKIEIECDIKKEYFDSLHTITSTPRFDIIHRKNIEKDKPTNIQYSILLDEVMKIERLDPKERLFYTLEINSKIIPEKIDITVIPFLNSKMSYLNKYYRHAVRLNKKVSYQIVRKGFVNMIHYKTLNLYFELFKSKEKIEISRELHISKESLYFEIQTFYELLITDTIPFETQKEVASCAVGLGLSVLALYEVNSNSKGSFLFKFSCLRKIFEYTKGYYKKGNFLLSLLFEIITSDVDLKKNNYKQYFFNFLKDNEIPPTTSIMIKTNNPEEQEEEPKESKQQLSFHILSIKDSTPPCKSNEHEWPDEKMINSEYQCSKCNAYRTFLLEIEGEKFPVEKKWKNAKDVLIRILRNVLVKRGLEIKNINSFYDNWYEDIYQLCIFCENYFPPVFLLKV